RRPNWTGSKPPRPRPTARCGTERPRPHRPRTRTTVGAMLRWLRRHALPPEIRARLVLAPGERVIAHALTGDRAAAVVATTAALHLPDGRRVPWERVDRAGWNDVGLALTVEGEPEQTVPLPAPGRLAQAVYERVTATIVVSRDRKSTRLNSSH